VTGKASLPEALRSARALPLERDLISGLTLEDELGRRFARACVGSLAALRPDERRGGLAGVTGHVGESVVEIVLDAHGWSPVWHFEGPGRHGVDLLLLGPGAERLFAVEVKATLRPRYWPRVPRRLDMPVWLDKADNPGMEDWGVLSDDVFGAVVLVNFHDRAFKAALTADFASWLGVMEPRQLDDLEWATRRPASVASPRGAPAGPSRRRGPA
jgi:hypothetical protein